MVNGILSTWLNSKPLISARETIRYNGDDSVMNITTQNKTIYFKTVTLAIAHPVLLSAGGILVGYFFQENYYRQMFYSSQVIASRTCYAGKWSDWKIITTL